jgi:hypothetical protein
LDPVTGPICRNALDHIYNPEVAMELVWACPECDASIFAVIPPVRDLTEDEMNSLIDQVMGDVGLPAHDDGAYEDWIIRCAINRALAILKGKS